MTTTVKREFVCSYANFLKLKVNATSISAEQKTIRKYEERIKAQARKKGTSVYPSWDLFQKDRAEYNQQQQRFGIPFDSLRNHRKGRLRHEARLAHLTLAFVKGKKYKQCEASTKDPVTPSVLQAKWNKFHVKGDAKAWLEEAG